MWANANNAAFKNKEKTKLVSYHDKHQKFKTISGLVYLKYVNIILIYFPALTAMFHK